MRILKFIFVLGVLVGTANSSQSLKELMTPPADSADRENLRIWVSVERASSCRMTINILNGNGDVIRHLVDALVPHGYHNFYWDKKDDSGEYVFAGEYRYVVEDCVMKDSGVVKVNFKSEEIKTKIYMIIGKELNLFSPRDKFGVKVNIYDSRVSLVLTPVDTTIGFGFHEFVFPSTPGFGKRAWNIKIDSKIPSGSYRAETIVNGEIVSNELVNYVK